jgi:ATP-dependent DNA helicase RecG
MPSPHETPVQYLKGIGPKRAKYLEKRSIKSVEDLLYFFPRRYEDRTNLLPVSKLVEGDTYTLKARVLVKGQRQSFRRRGFNILEVVVGDETGKITCVWFNQPYLRDYFEVDDTVILYGKVERYAGRLQMSNPEFEIVKEEDDESLSLGRIVPVYSSVEGIGQRGMRRIIKHALDEYCPRLLEPLSYDIRSRNRLVNLAQALIHIHFPQDLNSQSEAYKRLAFEEFFLFQLPLAIRKLKGRKAKGFTHKVEGELISEFLKHLPFELTDAQKKVIAEIKSDMSSPQAMQRLLQGDVGSGKTVVATVAALIAIQSGHQAVFMAPTEILAKQHYEKIRSQIPETITAKVRIVLLTAGTTDKDKVYKDIAAGKADLVIGTHALLEKEVKFRDMGFVVIDEQHKFGVSQRSLLAEKGRNPDILIMTATPIPRTLAITLYGDMDISVINEMPQGRLPVQTRYFLGEKRARAYDIAKEELVKGNQVFIVYPVIEDSYALDIAGAKKMFAELKEGVFMDFKLGLIHGKLKQDEQDKIMLKFKNRALGLLVATTVLEVGIDVPTATCMIIEHAERFGLSSLHQLRGRVGRGKEQSYCIMVSDLPTPEAEARINAMVKYNDGFRIAEEDLKIRGPGEFFGSRQHGLTELKIGNPLAQMQLLKHAREEAVKLVASDPGLSARQNSLLKIKLLQRFPEYEKLMLVA